MKVLIKFNQEPQDKQKLYLGVFRNYNATNTDLGRNPTVFWEGKRRTKFIKTEKNVCSQRG